jgi:hypothetical protein
MVSILLRSVYGGGIRTVFLFLGLVALSTGVVSVTAASQTTLIVADRDLAEYWRTTYDILVRPKGARSSIEEAYGLVEANHLSGIWGGITFEQYEMIKNIPGVETAAPIAMIGYVSAWAPNEQLSFSRGHGAYVLEQEVLINEACQYLETLTGYQPKTFIYYDPGIVFDPHEYNRIYFEGGITLVDRVGLLPGGGVQFPILMAGIDPQEEAALIPLEETVWQGRYLQPDESLELKVQMVWVEESVMPERPEPINLPILINTTIYIDLVHYAELKHVLLPEGKDSLESVMASGGSAFLDNLPAEGTGISQMDSQAIYQRMIELITPRVRMPGSIPSPQMYLGHSAALSTPSGLIYQESSVPFHYDGLVLSLQLPATRDEDRSQPQYRASLAPGEAEFNIWYLWDVIGIFDIEDLPLPAEVSSVPLETYFPPVAILRYDERGSPVDPRCTLNPTLNPEGYIQPPPLVLTTLQAAHALRGEEAISAIRVRVGDIDGFTPYAQRKIEAIAIEIARRTGLEVDIMAGSSPRRILVHVPGIGYVEEQWIQKGVNLVYKQGIQAGNWLLLGTLLAAGGLFTLDLT